MKVDQRFEALLKEYEALTREKLIHKEALRKMYFLLGTAISAVVGATRIAEPTSIFVSLIFPPVVLITVAYGVNELFQIYQIGTHISVLEQRVGKFLGDQETMTWESMTCRMLSHPKIQLPRGVGSILHPAFVADIVVVVFGLLATFLSITNVVSSSKMIAQMIGIWFIGPKTFLALYFASLGICALSIALTAKTFRFIFSGGLERAIRGQYEGALYREWKSEQVNRCKGQMYFVTNSA